MATTPTEMKVFWMELPLPLPRRATPLMSPKIAIANTATEAIICMRRFREILMRGFRGCLGFGGAFLICFVGAFLMVCFVGAFFCFGVALGADWEICFTWG